MLTQFRFKEINVHDLTQLNFHKESITVLVDRIQYIN